MQNMYIFRSLAGSVSTIDSTKMQAPGVVQSALRSCLLCEKLRESSSNYTLLCRATIDDDDRPYYTINH